MTSIIRITLLATVAVTVWSQATADADGDGVPDVWENDGVELTYADGSKQKLDLKAMGATANHKDLFVWIAWMEGAGHTHRPKPGTLEPVRQAFANAPLSNPDGQTGVRLHLLYAKKALNHIASLGALTGQPPVYDWTAFQNLKDASMPKPLDGVFHFCVFAHLTTGMGGSSGLSRGIGGYDFIVSLGGFDPVGGTPQDQAGTFMHELGHNLGLRHGGVDHRNWKPNYLSVMNYSFQLDGLIIDGEPAHFDYSRFVLPPLGELQLNRSQGLTADPTLSRYGSQFFCGCAAGTLSEYIPSITGVVDWDCSSRPPASVPVVVSQDTNKDCAKNTLAGQDDWAQVRFKDYPGGSTPPSGSEPTLPELTFDMARGVILPPVIGLRAAKEGANVVVSWKPIPIARVLAYRVFRQDGDAAPILLASTDLTSHKDHNAQPGRPYRYFVRALFAGRGAVDRIPLDPNRKTEFRTLVSPRASREYAMLGVDAAGVGDTWNTPGLLYQGPASMVVSLTP